MKNTLLILALLISSSAFVPARTAKRVMTNKTIQAMISGGVPLSMIVRAIRIAAQIDLYMNDRERIALKDAGATDSDVDEVMKAIHYREYTGVDKSPEFALQVAVVDPAPMPAAPELTPEELMPGFIPVPALPVLSESKTLEDGTPVKLRLAENLTSARATTQQSVAFEVLEQVRVGDLTVIPKGSAAWGTVTAADRGKHMGQAGKVDINLDAVRLADGEKVSLKGSGHYRAKSGSKQPANALAGLFWPIVPFFLQHGVLPHSKRDVKILKGTELTAYVNGNATLNAAKFAGVLQ